uniref:Transmembrane protein n=1 Tax=Mycena chlorophos TaxID=658473 RepID=A0ABQ0M6G8_MYCCL|nr:predicted protein [Mycena chlorophos]
MVPCSTEFQACCPRSQTNCDPNHVLSTIAPDRVSALKRNVSAADDKTRQSSQWSFVPPPLPPLHLQANMLSLTSAIFLVLVASAFVLVTLLFVAASLPADVLGRLVSSVSQRRRLPILDEENAALSVTVVPSFVVLSRPKTITNTLLSASVSITFPSYLFASSPSCESVSDLEPELPLPSKPLTQLVEAVRVPIILFAPRTQALETVVLDETRVIPQIILTPAPDISEPSAPLLPAESLLVCRERSSSVPEQKRQTAPVQRRGKENVRPATPPKSKRINERYFRPRAGGRSKPLGPKQRIAQPLSAIGEEDVF